MCESRNKQKSFEIRVVILWFMSMLFFVRGILREKKLLKKYTDINQSDHSNFKTFLFLSWVLTYLSLVIQTLRFKPSLKTWIFL